MVHSFRVDGRETAQFGLQSAYRAKTGQIHGLDLEDEATVVVFRRHTLLPLDNGLYALQTTTPHLTRSSLHFASPGNIFSAAAEIPHAMDLGEPFLAHAFEYACAQNWFSRTLRAVIALCCVEDAGAQKRESGTAIHGSLPHLQPIDLALYRARCPRQV